jgi:hypothetical protein
MVVLLVGINALVVMSIAYVVTARQVGHRVLAESALDWCNDRMVIPLLVQWDRVCTWWPRLREARAYTPRHTTNYIVNQRDTDTVYLFRQWNAETVHKGAVT